MGYSRMAGETIEIELLGVARLLARRASVSVPASGPIAVAGLVQRLVRELPALAATVFAEDGSLLGGHVFARDGRDLLQEPAALVYPGERLQSLSIEAGG